MEEGDEGEVGVEGLEYVSRVSKRAEMDANGDEQEESALRRPVLGKGEAE